MVNVKLQHLQPIPNVEKGHRIGKGRDGRGEVECRERLERIQQERHMT